MLAVVAERRRDGKTSFIQLVSYTILREESEVSETRSPDKPFIRRSRSEEAIFDDLVSYAIRNALPDSQVVIAVFPDGRQQLHCDMVICETNCFSLATASTEMDMVAMQNTRCADPVWHVILSWPEQERPTPDQVFASARYCLKRMGMEGHQYVFAIHDDTDNLHCHLTVNRINPVSFKAATLYNDHFILDRCCRELELRHGWWHDNGPYVVNGEGDVVRSRNTYKPSPSAARQMEYFGDKESLFSYAQEKCQDKLDSLFAEACYSWNDIHEVLQAAGLELREKGQGLAIYDLSNEQQVPLRASRLHPDLTLGCQQELIGTFVPAPVVRDIGNGLLTNISIESRYNNQLHKRDPGEREERRLARAGARQDLIARYTAYKESFVGPSISPDEVRTRFAELAARYRIRRNNVRAFGDDPLLRKLMLRALEVERMKDFAALRLQIKEERQERKNLPGARCLSYRAWVEEQATSNDTAAIAQLRGWKYREKRLNTPVSDSVDGAHYVATDKAESYLTNEHRMQVRQDG